MKMEVNLLNSVDKVSFGMTREEVREQWGEATEFMKNKDNMVPTDDFGFCHVYYDMDDKCEAIELCVKAPGKSFGVSVPGISHSDIRGLVTYRSMVRRELYRLSAWITDHSVPT